MRLEKIEPHIVYRVPNIERILSRWECSTHWGRWKIQATDLANVSVTDETPPPPFMEPKCSLPFSQQHAPGQDLQPHEFIPHSTSLVICPILLLSSRLQICSVVCSLHVLRPKSFVWGPTAYMRATCPADLILR